MKTLRLVLGDQLSLNLSSLSDLDRDNDVVLMAEAKEEATYVPHHPKKIALIFAAMRHFAKALEDAGVAFPPVPPRYRSTYFSHIIGGYSAGYYSYIWSEVLGADSVEWFKENGGMLRENGDHFRRTLLSRGGSDDAMTLFRNFRGAEPNIQPLLERRGLIAE